MGLDDGGDIGLEPIDAAMHAALDLLVAEESEPAFYSGQEALVGVKWR